MTAYKDVGVSAAEWLLGMALEAPEGGLGWPAQSGSEIDDSLYAGTPGVVLTMLDAYAVMADERYLDAARKGGRHLRHAARAGEMVGLYAGVAGIGFALRELAGVTKAPEHEDAVGQILSLVRASAVRVDGTVHWSEVTDVIVGATGVGLWLLTVDEPELAREVGRWLVGLAVPEGPGCKWKMAETYPELMPNFSHGTSGVAYFLATLAGAGLGEEFLDAAIDGARYLESVARRDGGGFRVFHWEPGGEDEFPLGWCHGPTGTARLFERLRQVTGESRWTQLRDACARGVRTSGIPARREPGFWDNVAACCGSTGVARFFLDMHRATGEPDHLAFARELTDDLVARATVDDAGTRWSNVEHRLQDPTLPPQTGAMQGAAGIASWLFELDSFLEGRDRRRVWPDSPF